MICSSPQCIENVIIGQNTKISSFVNLYGCEIGDNTRIGAFVEIQKGAKIGRSVKISSHSFICEGVTIEDEVFIGHNVSFINDKYPRATTNGTLQTETEWECIPTLVRKGASIGTSSTILCGVTIGECAQVGAGSVVSKDVPPYAVVAGVPARVLRYLNPKNPDIAPTENIPFLDLKAQYKSIKTEVIPAIDRVLNSCSFTLGEDVVCFETEFSAYQTASYGVAVNSGTSALHLALLAAGIGPGDEVITVAFTFVATVAAIEYTGAKPVLVDVDKLTLTMDPCALEKAITSRTKAIIPVHIHGQAADMDPITEIAKKHGLTVIEDACQAHGAEYKGQRVGTFGTMGCFSFYPGKNLGAYGEGGMVLTNDGVLAEKLTMLRNWGSTTKYRHDIKGFNARMEGLQGAILRIKLKHLEKWTESRRRHATMYRELLSQSPIKLPIEMPGNRHVYHIFAIRVPNRDRVQKVLADHGIQTGIHYPLPIHLQPAYSSLGYKRGEYPNSESAATEVLSLPMFPELTCCQIEAISAAVIDATAPITPIFGGTAVKTPRPIDKR